MSTHCSCGTAAVLFACCDTIALDARCFWNVPGPDMISRCCGIRIASEVARQLWVPSIAPFRSVHEFVPTWLDEVNATDRIRHLYEKLGANADTLVHGDLHHHNIVRNGDRWVAIDSKAMLCEPEFDVAPLMWNPIGSEPSLARIQHCVDRFANVGLDRDRMLIWALIRATYLARHDVAALLAPAL